MFLFLVLAAQEAPDRAREHIARVRGLEFRREVPIGVHGKEELRRFLAAEFERQFPRSKAARYQRAWAHFGLIPGDLDLYDSLLMLFGESVAGFYHPQTREVRLIRPEESVELPEGADFAVDMNDVTLVHELTHAAQDQQFDLRTLPIEEETDDDLAAASRALIEGDAFACGWNFVYRSTFDRMVRLIADRYKKGRLPGRAGSLPEFLRRTAVFPESYGCDFVLDARQAAGGDWKAVSRLYEDLPASTEQILHPETYWKNRDRPTVVTLPDLGSAWSPAMINVHGEFTIRILVGETAAAGWDGDRYHVFERAGIVSSVWFSRWDGEEDAREFQRAWAARSRLRHPDARERVSSPDRLLLAKDSDRVVLVERRGVDVVAIDGEAGLLPLTEKIWKETKTHERGKVERFRIGRWTCPGHPFVERTVDTTCPECGARLREKK